MVPGNRDALPSRLCVWPGNDIDVWPVLLEEIEVGSSEILKRMAQVSHNGDCLEKHFRQHDSRSPR